MLVAWSVLLVSLLAGEIVSKRWGLPLPGAVLGMALLVLLLGVRRRAAPRLERAAAGLLRYMPLSLEAYGAG
jgi:holin-like protein